MPFTISGTWLRAELKSKAKETVPHQLLVMLCSNRKVEGKHERLDQHTSCPSKFIFRMLSVSPLCVLEAGREEEVKSMDFGV